MCRLPSNENKMSDGGRERASLGVEVWKSSQKWSAQRSAVRSIAWLDARWRASRDLNAWNMIRSFIAKCSHMRFVRPDNAVKCPRLKDHRVEPFYLRVIEAATMNMTWHVLARPIAAVTYREARCRAA